MKYSYGEVNKKRPGCIEHETLEEYVDELYKYNLEGLFVSIV